MVRFETTVIYSDPGDPIHILYAPKVLDDGQIELVEAGKENTDEIINSYKESTDIQIILQRAAIGDMSGLNVKNPMYGDFTQVPKTFAEVLQLQMDSERLFNNLPADVRQKFDNDKNKFFAQSGTVEWYENIKDVIPDDVRKNIFPDPEKVKSREGE